jgi:hypothetical protein|tara:strand:+ start:8 stop:238 length:231 start_codon:yes stop_codon:yes gene_type:complete
MSTSTENKIKDMPDERVVSLYLQGIQVYEDQIELMEYVRSKSVEVRNDLVELEDELRKRNVEIELVEREEKEEEEV